MDALLGLQRLSLVQKICSELKNHIGVDDKTLAEFIIELAQENSTLPAFMRALDENGAEFPEDFASTLLHLVQTMAPRKRPAPSAPAASAAASSSSGPTERFSGLAIPNADPERLRKLEEEALGARAAVDPAIGGRPVDRRPPPPPPLPGGRGGGGAGSSSGGGGSSSGAALARDFSRDADAAAEPGKVYAGRVTNVMDFGAFVQLSGVRGKAEGLVHVSLIQSQPLRSPHDALKRGQPCFVKVLSTTGSKMSLSLRDADQQTGADQTLSQTLPRHFLDSS